METVESLNKRLIDYFGIDTESSNPIWRLSWSTDQTEVQWTKYTKEGLEMLFPQAVEVKKYPFAQNKWVLERYVLVPSLHNEMTVKKSYEPMWIFDEGLPPKWEPIKMIVDTVYLALGKEPSRQPQYPDPDNGLSTQEYLEKESERVKQVQEDLFGNETDTGDALAHKEGVSVPHNFERIH
jgi:hypothetical protein